MWFLGPEGLRSLGLKTSPKMSSREDQFSKSEFEHSRARGWKGRLHGGQL